MSPDITMCNRPGCDSHDKCWRFTALPDPVSQAYFGPPFVPIENGKCEYFISNAGKKKPTYAEYLQKAAEAKRKLDDYDRLKAEVERLTAIVKDARGMIVAVEAIKDGDILEPPRPASEGGSMKQVLHDVEIRMECYCGDPHDFIHLGFDVAKNDWPPELYITFRAYHGGLLKRLKKAWHLLWAGWVERYPDCTSVGIDEVEKLREFCDRCLAAEQAAKGGKA